MYFQPNDLRQAVRDARVPNVRILAGGTDFYPSHGDRLPGFPILDVSRVAEMSGVTRMAEGWRIGGAATWRDVINADLPDGFDGLKAAAREVGSVQIQNAGTVAGNLCNASPAADGVPPLLTLNAAVELVSDAGTRRIPLAAFLLGVRRTALLDGEILAAVHVPDTGFARSGFAKLGSRKYLVISIAMVAVWVVVDQGAITDARVAVGACSPVAQRLVQLEADLVGLRDVAGVVTPAHFEVLTPIDDVRGSAGYRLDVLVPLIERALAACLEGA
jgi:CO/xanthine dehydrogenase FAD-binding subunit